MKNTWTAAVLAAVLTFSCAACAAKTQHTDDTAAAAASLTATALADTDEMFTDRDFEVGYSDCVTITLSDQGTTVSGGGVRVDGNTVTIAQEGAYLVTGTLSDGQILVDAPETAKIQLVLSGADISCSSSAAIYLKQANKVFLTLDNGTQNTLAVTGDYVQTDGNSVNAAVFSKCDLTMNGTGTLNIRAAYGHGVVSKDDLAVTSGTYVIEAAGHGLCGKDSVRIAGGDFTITAGKDGVHAENNDDASLGFVYLADGSFDITADGDGISAGTTLTALNGTYNISAGGGSANAAAHSDGGFPGGGFGQTGGPGGTKPDGSPPSGTGTIPSAGGEAAPTAPQNTGGDAVVTTAPNNSTADADATPAEPAATEDAASTKGIKAGGNLCLAGGEFTVDSADDAVHSNAQLSLLGGTFSLASGDDGIHADALTSISGGTVRISKSYEGIEGAAISISGGEISVTASDDGLNASGSGDAADAAGQDSFEPDDSANITISGGTLTVDASGDGIDSNGTLTVTGGTTYVSGPTDDGNGALDYGGSATVTGGILIAAGSSGMAVGFGSDSTQGAILYQLSASQEAGTAVTLKDSSGSVLAQYTPTKPYQSVVITAPGIASGGSYTLTAGTESAAVELSSATYSNAQSGSGFGGGRGQGGQRPVQGGVDAS